MLCVTRAFEPFHGHPSFGLVDGRYSFRLGPLSEVSLNTVQLVGEYSEGGGVLGLGPVGVVGAFDLPFRHLAFDHSR